jgi:tRNA (Thr-GGU) A37 N-methylase
MKTACRSHWFRIYGVTNAKTMASSLQTRTSVSVFATRAPKRPNAIGLSVVRLLGIEKNVLHIENVDMLDGTPQLDIKPYVQEFDRHTVEKNGWIGNKADELGSIRSDKRFE